MTMLTAKQDEMLRAAAADAGSIRAPANPRYCAALIKQGLMISVPQAAGWSLLVITVAGLAFIAPVVAEKAVTTDSASAEPEAPIVPTAQPAASSKTDQLILLLERPAGATIEDMTTATGWQAHSIRGAISGTLKKARGLNVISELRDGARRYSLTPVL
jgi:hypothetical protein